MMPILRSVAFFLSTMGILGAREPGSEGALREIQAPSGKSTVSVADFGAVGDGIHDDGPAIAAAFEAAKADGVPSTVVFGKLVLNLNQIERRKAGRADGAWDPSFRLCEFADQRLMGCIL